VNRSAASPLSRRKEYCNERYSVKDVEAKAL
jgi:hypothetical protein